MKLREIEFHYLADRPEYLEPLASSFFEEWGKGRGNTSLTDFEGTLAKRLNRDRLPLTVVGLHGDFLISSASLIYYEIHSLTEYHHWLASVYVMPPMRRRGIGSLTVEYASRLASQIGIEDLYLYTRGNLDFYQNLGWKPVETVQHRDRDVIVMCKSVNV